MSSFPPLTGPIRPMTGIAGAPPDLAAPPPGCKFHPRCPRALTEVCCAPRPVLRDVCDGHAVACARVEVPA
jgi:oligopeptide/dipeptide ABC transporter ATP-binding protein